MLRALGEKRQIYRRDRQDWRHTNRRAAVGLRTCIHSIQTSRLYEEGHQTTREGENCRRDIDTRCKGPSYRRRDHDWQEHSNRSAKHSWRRGGCRGRSRSPRQARRGRTASDERGGQTALGRKNLDRCTEAFRHGRNHEKAIRRAFRPKRKNRTALQQRIPINRKIQEMETTLSIPRELQVTRSTLENGLKVLIREIPNAPVAGCWTIYRVGSRNEKPGLTGISHWVEHMLFKGGGKLAKGDIGRLVSRVGGEYNGFTSKDFTAYYEILPADHIDTGLLIESERMMNAAFDPREVESERSVVVSEREGNENDPKIEESFAPLSKTENPPEPNIVEPAQAGERRIELRIPSEADYIKVAYHTPGFG